MKHNYSFNINSTIVDKHIIITSKSKYKLGLPSVEIDCLEVRKFDFKMKELRLGWASRQKKDLKNAFVVKATGSKWPASSIP